MSELIYLDAVELASLYRSKKVSPVEVMEETIKRSELINPYINALSDEMYASALVKAAEYENAFANGEELHALAGIPVTAKEKHPIAGERICHGLNLKQDPIATESHVVVDRILDAGGIIHSRGTTPEFSCATFTQSTRWGVTRNPFNLDYSPGGSSGGSAAAVASGMATLATASDIGGSTRLPASFTGIVGYKPPYGKIPGLGVLAVDHYRSDGPLARSVRDTALLTNIIAGLDETDHATVPKHYEIPLIYSGDLKGIKIALCMQLGDYQVGTDVERNTRNVIKVLEAAGAVVEEITLPWTSEEIMRIASIHYANILVPGLEKELGQVDSYADYIDTFIHQTKEIAGKSSYFEGLQMEFKMQQEFLSTLKNFDALICPSSAIAGLLAGETYLNGIKMQNGQHVNHYWEAHMAVPFNIMNRLPVLSVPSGLADCGIPTGVQIVGKLWDEKRVFEIGAAIEILKPWRDLWSLINVDNFSDK